MKFVVRVITYMKVKGKVWESVDGPRSTNLVQKRPFPHEIFTTANGEV